MKGNVTRPADVKRGKLPRKTSGNPYGALAQLVARDIRIVEVRGSTPLCSTKTLQINVCKVFTLVVIPVAIVFLMGIPFSQISLWACIISIVVTNWNTCISLLPEKDKSDKQGGKRMKNAIKAMAVTGICGAIY